jgi:hypothetical protein
MASLVMTVTDNPSVDLFMHIAAQEVYYEITISLNSRAMNFEISKGTP